ncbi:MAG TPA: hypothetical protein VJP45_01870 [Candidatus Limnocylindria bacterium]|nr:hypothetical protein [Candidatus Limnocylindria bacterium]
MEDRTRARTVVRVATVIALITLSTCGAPAVAPSPTSSQSARTSPTDAAILIRTAVTGARPLLIANDIPDAWTASVVANANAFTATYRSSDGVKTVTLAIAAANPPLPGPATRQDRPAFHGDASSLYQVTDDRIPTSQRILVWVERGHWVVSGRDEVPYMLSAEGLNETEFWRIANGLHPNQL